MAPTVAGTECLTIAEDGLIESLANSLAFRTWTGTASVAAAKAKIYVDETNEPADTTKDRMSSAEWTALFPLALIQSASDDQGYVLRHTADAAPRSYSEEVRLLLLFEQIIGSGANQDAIRTFKNSILAIIKQVREQSGLSNRLAFSRATATDSPHRRAVQDRDDLGNTIAWQWLFEEIIEEG